MDKCKYCSGEIEYNNYTRTVCKTCMAKVELFPMLPLFEKVASTLREGDYRYGYDITIDRDHEGNLKYIDVYSDNDQVLGKDIYTMVKIGRTCGVELVIYFISNDTDGYNTPGLHILFELLEIDKVSMMCNETINELYDKLELSKPINELYDELNIKPVDKKEYDVGPLVKRIIGMISGGNRSEQMERKFDT